MAMIKRAKVKMFLDKDKKWRFRITFPNGRIAATSEAYSRYRAALNSANALISYMLMDDLHSNVDQSEFEKLKKKV